MTDPANYACGWDAPSCRARVWKHVAPFLPVITEARTLIQEREQMRRPLSLREVRLKRAIENLDKLEGVIE